jgi:hypothetical protein
MLVETDAVSVNYIQGAFTLWMASYDAAAGEGAVWHHATSYCLQSWMPNTASSSSGCPESLPHVFVADEAFLFTINMKRPYSD